MATKSSDIEFSSRQADLPVPLLGVGYYRLHFNCMECLRLPKYAGSAWRGLFGHALKKAVCVTHEPVCEACLLYRNCAYPYIFETPLPTDSDRMKRYTAVPHPFVVYPQMQADRTIEKGEAMLLELAVFGRANAYLPYIIHAFNIAGKHGIGKQQGKFRMLRVEQDTSGNGNWETIYEPDSGLSQKPGFYPLIPECSELVKITLQSPLRLKRDGRLVGAKEFSFHDLYRNLLRRIAMLTYFHEKSVFEPDFATLAEASRNINIIDKDLHWFDWTRYSSRQKKTMQMGGLTGEFTVRGESLPDFWPLLWLGQWTHAGKGASMGLGRYRLQDAASLPDRTNSND